jgi:hypothetical protein
LGPDSQALASRAIDGDRISLDRTRVGEWRIKRRLGEGGMGVVDESARADG